MGLDGAIQRLIVNGDVMDDLVILAKDSREITRYVGPACNDVDDPKPKCQNGGICRPYFRAYVCKCPPNYMGIHCEKGTNIRYQRNVHNLEDIIFSSNTLKFSLHCSRIF